MTADERERIARLEVHVSNLSDDLLKMSSKVDEMHGFLMQARGARWAIIAMASVGGFAAGTAAKFLPFIKG
ncbi:hypothetical protein [Chelativorans xinjiangense]|uniref:hypothetical protein n=1 Tax=Chelativorans xinjiangense TaxID=2681485 RepID=UPI00135A4197|nr:hypothetical protein [Chelativorans xinjiangense]